MAWGLAGVRCSEPPQGSDIADAGTPRGSRRSLVGRLRGKRAVFARLLQNIEVEDELADLLLELLDLFILQGVLVLGACPQRILGPEQEPVPPLLHLGHRQPMLPGRGLGRGLTLQDAEDQRCPPLRGPALRGLRTLVCHDPPPAVIQSRLVGGLNSEGSSISADFGAGLCISEPRRHGPGSRGDAARRRGATNAGPPTSPTCTAGRTADC